MDGLSINKLTHLDSNNLLMIRNSYSLSFKASLDPGYIEILDLN
jgi:hypothetical protein